MPRRKPHCASNRRVRKRLRVRRSLVESLEDRRLLAADPTDPNCIPPELNAPAQVSVAENTTLVVDIDATDNLDSEGSGLTYSISGQDAASFTIDSATGVLEFVAAPDFESPTLTNPLEVEVTVEDSNQLTDSATIQVTVSDVNEPPIANTGGPYSIDAGQTLDLDLSLTSDPEGDEITFEWDFNSDGTVDFSNTADSPSVPWLNLVDFVVVGTNAVTLTAVDSEGNSSTDTTTLEVSGNYRFEPLTDGNADAYTLQIDAGEFQFIDSGGGLLSRVSTIDITSIEVDGGQDEDTFTVDYVGGFISLPIDFDGGGPTSLPGDTLVISDSSANVDFPSIEHRFQDASSGEVLVNETTDFSQITYTGLEPIIDNLDPVDRTFTFLGGDETITLSDEGVVGNNINRIDSTLGELVDFVNPTNSLSIFTGSGVDIYTQSTLDSLTAFPTLFIDGGDAADTFNIESLPAAISAEINGGAENDTFTIGSTTLDEILGDINILSGGSVAAPGDSETISAKTGSVTATVDSGDTLNVIDSASATDNTYTLDAGIIARTAVVASGSITHDVQDVNLFTGTGNDTVLVANTTANATTTIETGAGNDTVTITMTGSDSIVRIETGIGNDVANVLATGLMSATTIGTGADDDDVNVTETGTGSGLAIDTGSEVDVVNLLGTGAAAITTISLGDGADVANIRTTAAASLTDIFGGSGNDTVNISSDADGDRISASGDPAGDLDGILGEICVFGEDNDVAPDNTTIVSAKLTDVTVTIARGDELNISDEASATDNDYTLSDTEFQRIGTELITYETIESLNLETGTGNDIVDVTTTAVSRTTLNTYSGADTVNIDSTADSSILIVDTGIDNDTVDVSTTGLLSVTTLNTGTGEDDVNVTTTGPESGLAIDTDSEVDVVNLFATGDTAITAISLGAGADIANIQATESGSLTDVFAGAGNDTVNISSDADGDRINTSGDPAGDLDGILGEICVFGEGNDAAPDNTTTVTAQSTDVTVTIARGDELNISDAASATDNDYTLSDTEFQRIGTELITYDTIESLHLETGTGDDNVDVLTTAVARTTLDTFAGADTVNIDTTADSSILIIETGDDIDVTNVTTTGSMSVTTIDTGADDDELVVTTTGAGSGLEINTDVDFDFVDLLATGDAAVTSISLGDEIDSVLVTTTGTMSVTEIETGTDEDDVTVTTTGDSSELSIDTGSEEDIVDVLATGVSSLTEITLGTGADVANIATTGSMSTTTVDAGADEDDVIVTTTGDDATLTVDAGTEVDVVDLLATGDTAIVEISLGAGDDIANIQSTASGSQTDVFAGAGNDTINISSDADGDRVNTSGDPAGDLDGILGPISVSGEANEGAPTNMALVAAKTSDVDVTIARGDELNISDEGSATDNDYELTDTTFQRIGTELITYGTIESINLETGTGGDTVDITTTAVAQTMLNTLGGSDTVNVTATSASSILIVDTGVDNDEVNVTETGSMSVTTIATAAGEDDVEVSDTGAESGLAIDTGTEVDVVDLLDTGEDAITTIRLGEGADVANLQETGMDSFTDVFGGAGNDTVNISSDADGDRINASGDPAGNLDGILGEICVFGEDHDAGTLTESVDARQTIGVTTTISTSIETGDSLNITDESSVSDNSYSLNATTVQRVGTSLITYATIEELAVETGQGSDTVDLETSADASGLSLSTFAGDDVVTVATTGSDSITQVDTGDDADIVTFATSGDNSVSLVATGGAADTVELSSIGDVAGIAADTGTGADQVELQVEPAPTTRSGAAAIQIQTGDGPDSATVNEVYLNSVVDLNGEADNDTFTLNAAGSGARGTLENLNDDPASGSAAIASTRQLFIEGGDNGAATEAVTQGVAVVANNGVAQAAGAIETGDLIQLNAAPATDPLDLRHVITADSQGVLATTEPASPRSTVGNEVFETLGVESVAIDSGSADDVLTVSSDIPFDILQTGTFIDFDGNDGDDKLETVGTAGADQITIGEIGGSSEPIEVDAVEFIRVDGNDGDDQVSVQTLAVTALDGGGGSDILLGGAGRDLLTGGPDVDFTFGGNGDDVLMSDQGNGSDLTFLEDGEILNGGNEDSLAPGDVCVQLGADTVFSCETLADGGAAKDVLTWLRAILIPLDALSFIVPDPLLDPFDATDPISVALDSVTEPSQVAFVAPLNAVTQPSPEPTDVNRDGVVSPRDALVVMNHVSRNLHASGEGVMQPGDEAKDVNGDGSIQLIDALIIINELDRRYANGPEGEAVSDRLRVLDQVLAEEDDAYRWMHDVDFPLT